MTDAVVVICSRIESRRLPGKALKRIAGITALDHILMRLMPTGLPVILAVPKSQESDYSKYAQDYPFCTLAFGDPESPLHRTAKVLKGLPKLPKWCVRITCDDIIIDARTLKDLIAECERQEVGYGISPGIVDGAGVEVIRSENILEAAKTKKEPTEFISYFVKGQEPHKGVVRLEPRQAIKRSYRLTMDYPADALVLEIVLRQLGAMASTDTICRYLDTNPHILNLNKLPTLSIYTCVKDMAKWVGDTMLSVFNSGIEDMEYIVVDDGSTDTTLSEVARFSGDPRLKIVVNEQNIGLASSSNRAISEARGKYVMRVDGDDMLIAGSFRYNYQRMVDSIEQGAGIVYPAYNEIDEHGNVKAENVSSTLNHHAGCALMDKRFLNECRFREGIQHWDSLELYKRASSSTKVAYLDAPTWLYRKRQDSMSNSDTQERERVLKSFIP